MSTQKRENRTTPATKTRRPGARCRWQRMSCTERAGDRGRYFPSSIASYFRADADGGTAPLWSIIWSIWAWLATEFLQLDQLPGQLVRPDFTAERTGSPTPPWVSSPPICGKASGAPVSTRSSLPPIPFLPGSSRLHLPLPQDPAAAMRRMERYDGKRDLYFLHAA